MALTMNAIEFGLGLRHMHSAVADAKIAEALGYQFLTCGEHVFFHGACENSLVALAAAAGATTSIKLMSTITLVPLYPPSLLAKQIATLDQVSNGRFHLGVGVGGEFEKEFKACGVPVNERGARTNEALTLMKRLWREDDVTFEGQFSSVHGVTLDPKPVQIPHPPIWVSGRSEAAMKRCAKHGTGWLPYMVTPERLASSVKTISQLAAQAKRAEPITPGVFLFFTVHRHREHAIKMATEHLSAQYQQDFSGLVGKYAVAGDPDTCIARLRQYADAGARTVIGYSACPDDYIVENESLFAKEVLPAFR